MSQHFLLSAAAKSLTVAQVMRLSDNEAEAMFRRLRWPETNGEPYCPKCGCTTCYDCRRANGSPRWECKLAALASRLRAARSFRRTSYRCGPISPQSLSP